MKGPKYKAYLCLSSRVMSHVSIRFEAALQGHNEYCE